MPLLCPKPPPEPQHPKDPKQEEKDNKAADEEGDHDCPAKPPVVVRFVKQQQCAIRWFNIYRQLCGLVVLANLLLMILAATGVFHSGTSSSSR